MLPAVVVAGIGAVANAVPPVAVLYHFKLLLPDGVAVNEVAGANWQEVTLLTVGAAGVGFTTTTVVVPALQLLTVAFTK